MYIFKTLYSGDDAPMSYELWKCCDKCSLCFARFFCYSKERVLIDGRVGVMVSNNERDLFGDGLISTNCFFTYLFTEGLDKLAFRDVDLFI